MPEAAPSAGGAYDFDSLLAPSASARIAPASPASSSVVVTKPAPAAAIPGEMQPSWKEFEASWDIYRDPIACGAIAGIVLGVLGVFVVLRRAVFVTAAVSQSAALGVALAFLAGIHLGFTPPPILAAFVLALASTAILAVRPRSSSLPREAVVGLLYVSASALAVLVGDRIAQEAEDVTAILFGTAVLVRPQDLVAVIVVSAVVLLVLGALHRGLVFAGFDPEGARVHRLPVARLELVLWVLVALQVSVTTRAIGALPVFAFSVLPAMAALRSVERLMHAVVLSAILGGLSGVIGYLAAFFLRFPVGAAEASVAALLFLVASGIGRIRRVA